ncbi:restriction endonuclease subunit S [Morganella sp. GD04133]|uniref:restriction endonuclease subunit S n=1 Tax=Morganella sp. GD04133 TaxID=2975435 RepID=UPI00244D4F80|nr:restriction endonuclease subunit S [Morganella sp. GD04133]MDH0354340.1 restriction endonuclease subunit S [Morganella sp. GD04133]
MTKYKAYPEYKDSGVEWVDSIPSHWEVKPTFALCEASSQKNIEGAENNVLSLSYGNIIPRDVETNFGLLPESFNSYQIVSCGDVILRLTDLQNDKNSLRVGLAKQKGIITSAYLKLKSKSIINPNFLYRLLHSYDTTKVFYGMGGGLRQSMKFEDFRRLPLLLPSYEEQIKISAFLDHETAKIDNLIEKQQQLIELLKEKRQAVINHAVTKGLNPDVPMKDSGVEWLGEVPEHWLCTKIKYISLLTPKKSSVNLKMNDECTFIPMEKLKRNSLVTDESKLIKEVVCGYSYFEDYDLLLAKVTPCFENKNIAVASGLINRVGFGSTEIYVLRPIKKVQVNYLLYRLQEDNFIQAATGAMTGAGGLKRVPSDFLLNYPIAIPPRCEMNAIVDFLSEQETRYDLMENNAVHTVKLLQERRTALISAAVTGKIDVRDWVAPDTQEIEKTEETAA